MKMEKLLVNPSTANHVALVDRYYIFPKNVGLEARWIPFFETFQSFAERVGIDNIIALEIPYKIKRKHSALMTWHMQNCPIGHC